MTVDRLLDELLRLPRRDRADLVERVLSSLEEPEHEVAAAWTDELERRARELDDGTAKPVNAEEARRDILNELKDRRADRASPSRAR